MLHAGALTVTTAGLDHGGVVVSVLGVTTELVFAHGAGLGGGAFVAVLGLGFAQGGVLTVPVVGGGVVTTGELVLAQGGWETVGALELDLAQGGWETTGEEGVSVGVLDLAQLGAVGDEVGLLVFIHAGWGGGLFWVEWRILIRWSERCLVCCRPCCDWPASVSSRGCLRPWSITNDFMGHLNTGQSEANGCLNE